MSNRMDRHLERLEENRGLIKRVEDCINDSAELNLWEENFLQSVLEQLMQGRELSANQLNKLEEIEYIREFGRETFFAEKDYYD